MHKFLFIFFSLFLIGCNDSAPEQEKKSDKNQEIIKRKFVSTQLIGEAQQIATTWKAYQNFTNELQLHDLSRKSTDRLIETVNAMKIDFPVDLTEQPVLSRLAVVETRLKIYRSYLSYTVIDQNEKLKRFNDFILAVDNFNLQLNEKPQYQQLEGTLLEQLKNDFDNAQKESDSIQTKS